MIRGFELVTRRFELVTRGFELVTRGFELVTRGFELVTRGFELVTRGFELVTVYLIHHLLSENCQLWTFTQKVIYFDFYLYFFDKKRLQIVEEHF